MINVIFKKIMNLLHPLIGSRVEDRTCDYFEQKELDDNAVKSGKMFLLTPEMLNHGNVCIDIKK